MFGGDGISGRAGAFEMPTSFRPPVPEIEEPVRAAEGVTAVLAFVTVAATTWAFGGRAEWAPALFGALSLLTALVAAGLAWREGGRFNAWAFAPLAGFVALVGASLWNLSHTPIEGATGMWRSQEAFVPWLPGTVDRDTTLAKALPWAAALLLGGALRQAAPGRRVMRWLLGALVVHGLAVALVGAWFHIGDPRRILGVVWSRNGYHFASFPYRNHWAAYVLVLVPVALGFAFSALRRWRAGRGGLDRVLPGLGAALLMVVTLPMPGSRSGTVLGAAWLAVALGCVAWGVWRGGGRRTAGRARGRAAAALVLFALTVLGAGLVINRPAVEKHWRRTVAQARSVAAGGEDLRLVLTRDTLRMAADRPVWGWGVGSYGLVFSPRYQGEYLRDERGRVTTRVVHAHNDWAQLAAELGFLGCWVLIVPAGVLLWRGLRAESPLARWAAAGAGGVMIYALADFPLHNPAVLLAWVTVLCAAAPPRLVPDAG